MPSTCHGPYPRFLCPGGHVQDYPGEIYVARKDSPMIIGVENGDCYVASDVPAILKYTRNVYYIGNLEMARLANGTVTFYNLDGDEIEKKQRRSMGCRSS